MIDTVKKNIPLPPARHPAKTFDEFGDVFSAKDHQRNKDFLSLQEQKLKDQLGSEFSFSSESQAFEDSLKRASQEQEESSFGEGKENPEDEEDRLLARSDLTGVTHLSASLQSPSVSEANPSRSGFNQTEFIQKLTTRIEQAVRIEIGLSAGNVLNLKLNFTNISEGLVGVSLRVTPTGLDVILERTTVELSPQLLSAAQELSAQLQSRFSRRIVRVFDRCVEAPQEKRQTFFSPSFLEETAEEEP